MQFSPDASTVDFARTRIRLCDDVRFLPQVYGDETFYHVELPSRSQYYRIGYAEYVFISLLDGETTFSEALAITARTLGASAFSQHQAMSLYTWLLEQNIGVFDDTDSARTTDNGKKTKAAQTLQKLNPFWIRLPFGRPDDILKALQPYVGWIFSPVFTVFGIFLIAAAIVQLFADWDQFSAASTAVFATDNWIWLVVSWIVLKVVHETAHGLTCQRYGGNVRETGIILAFFAPLAYVDVTSCWSFPSRWQRIQVAAAGMFIELVLASIAVFTWAHVDSPVISHLLYNVIVMASVSTLLFNANPLMRFDGYYILADLLQIPNLYSQASEAVQNLSSRWIWGFRRTGPVVTGRNLWILRVYGLGAIFWRLLICGSLLIAASVLFHGAGLLLVVAGTVAWFGLPLWKLGKLLGNFATNDPVRLFRGAVVSGCCAAVTAGILFGTPVPFSTTAPGVITLQEGRQIRSDVAGFIDRIYVTNGQQVEKGDMLLRLRNDEVANLHADVKLQIQQETIRHQIAMKEHDAGAAVVAKNNLKSLQDKLRETAVQLHALDVRATASGRIIAKDLQSRLQTHVDEGDDLLIVDDRQQRELRISVSQEDFPLARHFIAQDIAVRLGTRTATGGVLQRVIPRASRRLFDQALAATNGGSLPVTTSDSTEVDQDRLELTEQRFEGVVILADDAAATLLPVGERGYVSLGANDDSIASFLYNCASDWICKQIEVAQAAANTH